MRTVRGQRGVTWICLELPEIPVEQLAKVSEAPIDAVAIECNSGADRVIALVAPDWEEVLSDAQLASTIETIAFHHD